MASSSITTSKSPTADVRHSKSPPSILPSHCAVAPSSKLAFRRSLRHLLLLSLSFLLFLAVSYMLATPRIISRLSLLRNHFQFARPLLSQQPFSTSPSASFLGHDNATMGSLRIPPQAPPLFTGTKTSIVEDAKALCDKSKKVLDDVVAAVPADDASKATFESVMVPQLEDENQGALSNRLLGFYQYVSADSELRDASTEAEKIMNEFGIESGMRQDIFKLVDIVHSKKDALDIDPESLRLLEKEWKGYIRNGLALTTTRERDDFKDLKLRLSKVQIAFTKTLNEEDGGLWFTPEELVGIPQDVIDGMAKGEGENAGKVRLTFKYTDLIPALKSATNVETRRKVFIANENKCNDNVPLFKEAVLLRDKAARLLGYANHASFRLEERMAKTPKTVDDFLGDLRERLGSGGHKELQHLENLKKASLAASGETSDGNYYLWDHRFYSRVMVEEEYSVDESLIAEYFPLEQTIKNMLGVFEHLFGFVFHELSAEEMTKLSPTGKGEDMTWHPDVHAFTVWNDEGEGGDFVGYFYIDLHPRPGKYGHAANFNLQPGFLCADGKTRRYPATALVCNFSKPSAKKPSLLKHDEVVTLFHELGHGIHDLSGRTRYARFHGTSTVRDFVEAPSQMLENWCWDKEQLKSLSGHYETKAQLPDDLIEKQIATKNVNGALFNLRQLHFGIFDMAVHEPKSYEDLEKMDISKFYNDLRAQLIDIKGPEALGDHSVWGHGQATFGHLIGGYDAGYYGYLSSQVFSTDMYYSVFKKDPRNGIEGRRYRHMVLEKGGSQDEMLTLEQFLGRKPDSEAFYRELGLA